MLDTIKGGKRTKFQYNQQEDWGFEVLKKRIASQPILGFEKLFIVECDASNIAIGAILSQEGRPLAFHSEKLSNAKRI